MTIKDTGGPAFPRPAGDYNGTWHGNRAQKGMTLRDYFAAKAMQGILAAQIHGFNDQPANGPFADMSYQMADAMLRAREGA